MATPSVKTIATRLSLSASQAQELKKALVKADRGSPKAVDAALEFANTVLEAHGVEAIRGEHWPGGYYADMIAIYVNMGDSHNNTLLYDVVKDRFYITSYGDWVEAEDRAGRMVPNGSKRAGTHTLAPGTSVRVYDLGGATVDRYTVVMVGKEWDESARKGYKMMLGMGPGGRGVSEWGEVQEGKHLGRRVRWDDLPEETRRHIERRVAGP
jgi:hypothetical protein